MINMFTCSMSSAAISGQVGSATHEIPQSAKRGNTRLFTALHDLRITIVVRGDEDDYGERTRQSSA